MAVGELRRGLALMQQQVGQATTCSGCYLQRRCRKKCMLMQQRVGRAFVCAATREGCWL